MSRLMSKCVALALAGTALIGVVACSNLAPPNPLDRSQLPTASSPVGVVMRFYTLAGAGRFSEANELSQQEHPDSLVRADGFLQGLKSLRLDGGPYDLPADDELRQEWSRDYPRLAMVRVTFVTQRSSDTDDAGLLTRFVIVGKKAGSDQWRILEQGSGM